MTANLNTFFNSMGHSKYLRMLNTARDQGEGYGYLGLGMLVCCFLGIIIALSRLERREGRALKNIREYRKTHRVQINTFLLVFIVSFMWAVSTTVVINQNVLIDIKLPRLILGAFSIFRASGRFIWLPCMIVTFAASCFGQVGDLAASLVKRMAGVKDYGHLFLNHGGVLDRFDSVIFCAPLAVVMAYTLTFFRF